MKTTSNQPVIKWTGSKRLAAPKLSRLIPSSQRFFDPFVGGGAILPFAKADEIFAGDVLPELIELWQQIKRKPEYVADGYEKRWHRLQEEGHTAYYDIRDRFNSLRDPLDLLFLSRTCVNGLIRFNSEGDFNNSLHHTRPGINPGRLRRIIVRWSSWISNVSFKVADYRTTLKPVREGDVIFLDPPYAGSNGRGRYEPGEFDYSVFYGELERLNKIGAKWIVTLDGKAGNRDYENEMPRSLYHERLYVSTGKSPFTKLMGASIDQVRESVYLNFEITLEKLVRSIEGWE